MHLNGAGGSGGEMSEKDPTLAAALFAAWSGDPAVVVPRLRAPARHAWSCTWRNNCTADICIADEAWQAQLVASRRREPRSAVYWILP